MALIGLKRSGDAVLDDVLVAAGDELLRVADAHAQVAPLDTRLVRDGRAVHAHRRHVDAVVPFVTGDELVEQRDVPVDAVPSIRGEVVGDGLGEGHEWCPPPPPPRPGGR